MLSGTLNVNKTLNHFKVKRKQHSPFIEVQCLVSAINENYLKEIKQLATLHGADRIIYKSMQIYNSISFDKFLPNNDKFNRYAKIEARGGIVTKKSTICKRVYNSVVFTWNGDVLPCCYDKNGDHVMGNILDDSFVKIFNNDRYREFRNKLIKSRNEFDICKNCNE